MPLILPGNVASATAPTTFSVANSCRFNAADDACMHKTFGTPTNLDRWTISFWVKRCNLADDASGGEAQNVWGTISNDGSNNVDGRFNTDDTMRFTFYQSSSTVGRLNTTQKFRDPSAWYHIVQVWDSGNATAGNRMRFYVNGAEVTDFSTDTNPDQNLDSYWNSDGSKATIGSFVNPDGSRTGGDSNGDFYLAEFVFCDGQAYAASDFGEYDEDSPTIWKPKDVSGLTFGNNGFYLDFEDSSNLGNDANGGTDFTEVNIAAADQATDTPTNSFCTFNVLNPSFTGTNSQGNCKHLSSSSAWRAIYGTIPFTTGKWYAAFKMVADGSSAGPGVININELDDTFRLDETNRGLGQGENAVAYLSNAQILDGGNTIKTGQTTWTDGDILGVAVDATNGYVYWHKNGTYMDGATSGTTVGDPTSGGSGTGGYPLADLVAANGTYLFGVGGDDAWHVEANFGGCPAFSISSGNADANGYGNFEYAVPSGYYALCTKNLAEYG